MENYEVGRDHMDHINFLSEVEGKVICKTKTLAAVKEKHSQILVTGNRAAFPQASALRERGCKIR